ncbi:unnamed protein product [Lampetra planeri]
MPRSDACFNAVDLAAAAADKVIEVTDREAASAPAKAAASRCRWDIEEVKEEVVVEKEVEVKVVVVGNEEEVVEEEEERGAARLEPWDGQGARDVSPPVDKSRRGGGGGRPRR